MTETICNSRLSIVVSDRGAELQSVRLDGVERLWQGDASVWGERSPVLFPIVGRIKNGTYTYQGKEYSIQSPHGFARSSVFTLVERGEDVLVYRLVASPETKEQYPFDFVLDVAYRICDTKLTMTFTVSNHGSERMIYSFGAHPGFLVPPADGTEFSDWYLQFAQGETLNQALLDGMFMSRDVVPCPHAQGDRIPLTHAMFDDDAFILTGLKRPVFELRSDASPHGIVTDCAGFDYCAFWQATGSNAGYLCIEPWNGLPSDSKDPEDLEIKRDMRILAPGASETCSVSFRLS